MQILNRYAIATALSLASTLALGYDKIAPLIATLSSAKANAEGRAVRVRNCIGLKNTKTATAISLRYDSARNQFNAELNSWIFSLKERKAFSLDRDADTKQFESAINAINGFTLEADKAISSSACMKKVIWKEVAVAIIGISPALLELYRSNVAAAGLEEKEREALIKALEEQRIAAWDVILGVVAFNLESKSFIPFAELDEALARKATTAIYVNRWTVKGDAGQTMVAWKGVPDTISPTYQLFTGSLADLEKITIIPK